MISTLKSEFRKLLSVRSTYVVSLLACLFVIFVSFYIEGWQGVSGSAAANLEPGAITEIIRNAAAISGVFGTIVVVLFMVHEYRYNTIMYTLTASNSRTKVLLSKVITAVVYTIALSLIAIGVGLVSYRLGLSLRDASLMPQAGGQMETLGKLMFYNIAYSLIALLIAVLSRSIAASIAILFIAPSTVEPLLGLVLKDNATYLPFAALDKVITPVGQPGFIRGDLSPEKAMIVVLIYLVVGWVITWWLFLRRDAN